MVTYTAQHTQAVKVRPGQSRAAGSEAQRRGGPPARTSRTARSASWSSAASPGRSSAHSRVRVDFTPDRRPAMSPPGRTRTRRARSSSNGNATLDAISLSRNLPASRIVVLSMLFELSRPEVARMSASIPMNFAGTQRAVRTSPAPNATLLSIDAASAPSLPEKTSREYAAPCPSRCAHSMSSGLHLMRAP